MDVAAVTTSGSNSLLTGLRSALADADSALLCVAFVQQQGVHLLHDQLAHVGRSTRLLMTTVFGSSPSALGTAKGLGVDVSILNPGSGTYHPKVFLARHGKTSTAIVGSANLTGGLVTNVEAAVLLRGSSTEKPIADLWSWAEERWADQRRQPWVPPEDAKLDDSDVFEPKLFEALQAAVARTGGVFQTLGPKPRPNRVTNVTRDGIWVETEASIAKGTPPQFIPAWMLQLAWDYLRAHGSLSNRYLIANDGLNVKRSSAVCAILSTLEAVRVKSGRGIVLEWAAA